MSTEKKELSPEELKDKYDNEGLMVGRTGLFGMEVRMFPNRILVLDTLVLLWIWEYGLLLIHHPTKPPTNECWNIYIKTVLELMKLGFKNAADVITDGVAANSKQIELIGRKMAESTRKQVEHEVKIKPKKNPIETEREKENRIKRIANERMGEITTTFFLRRSTPDSGGSLVYDNMRSIMRMVVLQAQLKVGGFLSKEKIQETSSYSIFLHHLGISNKLTVSMEEENKESGVKEIKTRELTISEVIDFAHAAMLKKEAERKGVAA